MATLTRYREVVLRAAGSIIGYSGAVDPEDVAQTVFARSFSAFRKSEMVFTKPTASYWFSRCAQNGALDEIRARNRCQPTLDGPARKW